VIRVAPFHHLQRRLPELTRGEGVVESAFAEYRPVHGDPPARPRTDRNPLDRADYLRQVTRGG
jgi:ribosomal protection tetracycline resistance protein